MAVVLLGCGFAAGAEADPYENYVQTSNSATGPESAATRSAFIDHVQAAVGKRWVSLRGGRRRRLPP